MFQESGYLYVIQYYAELFCYPLEDVQGDAEWPIHCHGPPGKMAQKCRSKTIAP